MLSNLSGFVPKRTVEAIVMTPGMIQGSEDCASDPLSEKPVRPCNVNKVNNDQAGLQCTTTGEK